MPDTNQEPTMEEILASIRRIISEDDAPAGAARAASSPPAHVEPAPAEPEPLVLDTAEPEAPAETPVSDFIAEREDDVLELTDRVEDAVTPDPEPVFQDDEIDDTPEFVTETVAEEIEAVSEAASEPEPEPEPVYTAPEPDPEPYIPHSAIQEPAPMPSDTLVSRESSDSVAASLSQLSDNLMMPKEGRSLEDAVNDLLRPMLKDWLDANLPGIVQAKVEEEVERITRGRVR